MSKIIAAKMNTCMGKWELTLVRKKLREFATKILNDNKKKALIKIFFCTIM